MVDNKSNSDALVPAIRFEEFSGGWLEKTLSELGELKNGMNFSKEAMGHGHPFINLQDVFGKNVVSNKPLGLAVSSKNQRKDYNLEKGDVLFVRSSVKPSGVGEAAVVTNSLKDTTYSGFIIRFRPKQEMAVNFSRFVYSTSIVRKQIIAGATSSANTNINQESLQLIQLKFPKLTEQTKIGQYFQQLDTLITQHQQKRDKLLNLKKSLLEKMFPKQDAEEPAIRFKGLSGVWKKKKLDDLADIVRGASPRPIEDPKWFDKNSDVGWLRIKDVTEQDGRIYHLEQRISKLGERKTRVLTESHLLLSIAASVGKPVINYVSTGVHDGFLILKNPLFHIEFMYQWLKSFETQWQKYGQPGSQVNLNSEIVKNQEIFIPNHEEQAKIGILFQQLDTLITQHQTQLKKLNNIKQACLAKLFV